MGVRGCGRFALAVYIGVLVAVAGVAVVVVGLASLVTASLLLLVLLNGFQVLRAADGVYCGSCVLSEVGTTVSGPCKSVFVLFLKLSGEVEDVALFLCEGFVDVDGSFFICFLEFKYGAFDVVEIDSVL